MVRVNKTQFPEKLREELWGKFSSELKNSPSSEALLRKLRIVLTHAEITMLEKRLAIPILLEQGRSYREIGRMIDVSSTTINSIKHHFVKKPVSRHRYTSSLSKKSASRSHHSSKGVGAEIWKAR